MASKNFLDLLQDDMDSCRYCWQKNVCDNVNEKNMMPIHDKNCPFRWRKRKKNGK